MSFVMKRITHLCICILHAAPCLAAEFAMTGRFLLRSIVFQLAMREVRSMHSFQFKVAMMPDVRGINYGFFLSVDREVGASSHLGCRQMRDG